jgi:hypothetical protein
MAVETNNASSENAELKDLIALEKKAGELSNEEKREIGAMSDLDGKYTSVLEGIVSRYQK